MTKDSLPTSKAVNRIPHATPRQTILICILLLSAGLSLLYFAWIDTKIVCLREGKSSKCVILQNRLIGEAAPIEIQNPRAAELISSSSARKGSTHRVVIIDSTGQRFDLTPFASSDYDKHAEAKNKILAFIQDTQQKSMQHKMQENLLKFISLIVLALPLFILKSLFARSKNGGDLTIPVPESLTIKSQIPSITKLPEGLTLTSDGVTTRIKRKWYNYSAWIYLLIGLSFLFNSFTLFLIPIFAYLWFAIASFFLYYTTAIFKNESTIEISSLQLRVHHGPLFWPGNKVLASQSIEQIFCQEKAIRTRSRLNYRYSVQARLRDRRMIPVLTYGLTAEQAVFITDAIQKKLALKSHPLQKLG